MGWGAAARIGPWLGKALAKARTLPAVQAGVPGTWGQFARDSAPDVLFGLAQGGMLLAQGATPAEAALAAGSDIALQAGLINPLGGTLGAGARQAMMRRKAGEAWTPEQLEQLQAGANTGRMVGNLSAFVLPNPGYGMFYGRQAEQAAQEQQRAMEEIFRQGMEAGRSGSGMGAMRPPGSVATYSPGLTLPVAGGGPGQEELAQMLALIGNG